MTELDRLPAYREAAVTVYLGDAREVLSGLPVASVDCCVTSPPYWGLRDYGLEPQHWDCDPECCHRWDRPDGDPAAAGRFCRDCNGWLGDLGLEPSPELYVSHLVEVFQGVRRVLKPSGTLWLNLGDCYNAGTTAARQPSPARQGYWQAAGSMGDRRVRATNLKTKDLVGIPWRVALALQAAGWYLRSDVIWAKPNPMPESVRDRPTRAHEYLFLLAPSSRYFYDAEAVREPDAEDWNQRMSTRRGGPGAEQRSASYQPHGTSRPVASRAGGRNQRTVWTIPTQPYRGAHFATFPERLVEPCVLAGTSQAGCCSSCGVPWRRVVEVTYTNPGNRLTNGPRSRERRRETPGFLVRLERRVGTRAWKPGCACEADPVPATVLDPFAGSGTTLAVAAAIGRRAIGIELKPSYVALIKARCSRSLEAQLRKVS
jgi:DNA modification methylase